MVAAERAGKSGPELQAIEDSWTAQAGLALFNDAVVSTINSGVYTNKKELVSKFLAASKGKSNTEARAIAKGIISVDIPWNWDSPRTREGYYRLQGGCECAINRAIAYAPYADAIWMESKLPDYKQAEQFATGVHAVYPDQKYVSSIFIPFDPSPNLLSPSLATPSLTQRPPPQTSIQPLPLLQLEIRHAAR